MAGNGGWYFEVNKLDDLRNRIIPFFRRFPLIGSKLGDFEAFSACVEVLSKRELDDADYIAVLTLREGMNRGGKRTHSKERILRDYTPSPKRPGASG